MTNAPNYKPRSLEKNMDGKEQGEKPLNCKNTECLLAFLFSNAKSLFLLSNKRNQEQWHASYPSPWEVEAGGSL